MSPRGLLGPRLRRQSPQPLEVRSPGLERFSYRTARGLQPRLPANARLFHGLREIFGHAAARLTDTAAVRTEAWAALRWWVCCGACWFLLVAPNAASAAAPTTKDSFADLVPDKVVARGKGIEIKRSQVDEAFLAYKVSLAAQGQRIPEFERVNVLNQVLQRLIDVQLLLAKATPADKAKANEEADKSLTAYREKLPTEEAFKRQLLALGTTADKLRNRFYDEAIFKAVIDRELRPAVKISEQQAKDYYRTNSAQFNLPERAQIRRILILTQSPATRQDLPAAQKLEKKKLAENILTRLKAGEDFAKLAKVYSDDPRTREAGGLAEPFPRGYMVPAIDKLAFSMALNQVSGLIETPFGYQIIKLVEKLPARQVPFTEALPGIREVLERQEIQKQLPGYLAQLRTQAAVEIPEPLKDY